MGDDPTLTGFLARPCIVCCADLNAPVAGATLGLPAGAVLELGHGQLLLHMRGCERSIAFTRDAVAVLEKYLDRWQESGVLQSGVSVDVHGIAREMLLAAEEARPVV